MSSQYSVALVGDHNPSVPAHQAIPLALNLAAAHHGVALQIDWVETSNIRHAEADLDTYQGIWCVPASPYTNTDGALDSIRLARERYIPFLGTCGGFQHALIEYARNVLHLPDTAHAETSPDALQPLIAPLSCSLVEVHSDLILEPESLVFKSYGTGRISEGYRCSYGPNRAYENTLFTGDLRISARDSSGEIRAAELRSHPFFVGTLFQPERRALRGELPPLVRDFVARIINVNGPGGIR